MMEEAMAVEKKATLLVVTPSKRASSVVSTTSRLLETLTLNVALMFGYGSLLASSPMDANGELAVSSTTRNKVSWKNHKKKWEFKVWGNKAVTGVLI